MAVVFSGGLWRIARHSLQVVCLDGSWAAVRHACCLHPDDSRPPVRSAATQEATQVGSGARPAEGWRLRAGASARRRRRATDGSGGGGRQAQSQGAAAVPASQDARVTQLLASAPTSWCRQTGKDVREEPNRGQGSSTLLSCTRSCGALPACLPSLPATTVSALQFKHVVGCCSGLRLRRGSLGSHSSRSRMCGAARAASGDGRTGQ